MEHEKKTFFSSLQNSRSESVIDCCTRDIVGWDLSLRCRTDEALAALERAVLHHLPHGSRGLGLTLTTDTARSSLPPATLKASAGSASSTAAPRITIRRATVTSNASIAVSKKRRVWINEYQSFDHARQSIALWIEEYNHDRPHRGLKGQTPHESRAAFQATTLTSNLAQAELLKEIGREHGVEAGVVAIAWTLRHPAITAAIVGARRPEQVDGVLPAATFRLSDAEAARIERWMAEHP